MESQAVSGVKTKKYLLFIYLFCILPSFRVTGEAWLVTRIFFAWGTPKKQGSSTAITLLRGQEQNHPIGLSTLLNKVLLHISRECACASRHSS